MLTFGYLRIENQEIAIAKAELLCERREGYIIRLVAEFVGGGSRVEVMGVERCRVKTNQCR